MAIYRFCTGCKDFVSIQDIDEEEFHVTEGVDLYHYICKICGTDWWALDDHRDELEEDDG